MAHTAKIRLEKKEREEGCDDPIQNEQHGRGDGDVAHLQRLTFRYVVFRLQKNIIPRENLEFTRDTTHDGMKPTTGQQTCWQESIAAQVRSYIVEVLFKVFGTYGLVFGENHLQSQVRAQVSLRERAAAVALAVTLKVANASDATSKVESCTYSKKALKSAGVRSTTSHRGWWRMHSRKIEPQFSAISGSS